MKGKSRVLLIFVLLEEKKSLKFSVESVLIKERLFPVCITEKKKTKNLFMVLV